MRSRTVVGGLVPVALGMGLLFTACELFAPPEPFIAEVTYLGQNLEYNNSVGDDWTTGASVNGEEVSEGQVVTVSGTELELQGSATEYDESRPDYGEHTLSLRRRDLSETSETFAVPVVVVENGGAYQGHTAKWVFSFSVRLLPDVED